MKTIIRSICLIMCVCMSISFMPMAFAANFVQTGDIVYFGSYFASIIQGDDIETGANPLQLAEYVSLEVPDSVSGLENARLEYTKLDGHYYARRLNRSGADYYRADPIRWKVLEVKNNQAILLSDPLQQTPLHCNAEDRVSWQTSSIRSFLNSYDANSNAASVDFSKRGFLDIAFSDAERTAILPTQSTAEKQDKISIPSKAEIEKYLSEKEDRVLKVSERVSSFVVNSIYYLRDYDLKSNTFLFVRPDGEMSDGIPAFNRNLSIAAMMTIDLSKTSSTPVEAQTRTFSLSVGEPSTPAVPSQSFTDVSAGDWYYEPIELAHQHELMKGVSAQKFDPNGNLTIAQAITMAARTHYNYNKISEPFIEQQPWYRVYVDYAVNAEIIHENDFSNYMLPITRAEMAYVFAHALPDTAYQQINQAPDVPDVDDRTPYQESIVKLYRAGIVQGSNQQNAFFPERNITRGEAAAIIVRLNLADSRVVFSNGL